jgi:hypothetical protein
MELSTLLWWGLFLFLAPAFLRGFAFGLIGGKREDIIKDIDRL